VDRLEEFVRSVTRGGRRRAWFLQVDIANFFMSIDRNVLFSVIDSGLRKQYGVPKTKLPLFCENWLRYRAMRELAQVLIFHDCTELFARKSPKSQWRHIEDRKSLFHCEPSKGLPIGNLTSQFFGNVYLDALDQFIKHELKAKSYIRYVDDFVLLHEDKKTLQSWLKRIEAFLFERLHLTINWKAVKLRPMSCGINFLGYVVHSDHRLTRRRVVGNFGRRLDDFKKRLVVEVEDGVRYLFLPERLEELLATLNSYTAHLEKANSSRLLDSILFEHDWLNVFFQFENGKAKRRWLPPREFPRLSAQYGWHRWRYPQTVILFQVGRFHELYDRQARWAERMFGLKPQKPRMEHRPRVGVFFYGVKKIERKIAAAGYPVLKVRETGYPLRTLKERLSFELLVPTVKSPNV